MGLIHIIFRKLLVNACLGRCSFEQEGNYYSYLSQIEQ